MSRKRRGTWIEAQLRDPYVRKAHAEGLRSRAAFKLEELIERDRLLAPGMTVVDLGAAPGGWSEYVASRVGRAGRVLAIDLLAMEPLAGVEIIQGDFADEHIMERVLHALAGRSVELVLSDMAPNITGVAVTDEARSAYLAELAMDFAHRVAAPDGALVLKLFHGRGFDDIVSEARRTFRSVKIRKPQASRAKSRETYLVARGLRAGEER